MCKRNRDIDEDEKDLKFKKLRGKEGKEREKKMRSSSIPSFMELLESSRDAFSGTIFSFMRLHSVWAFALVCKKARAMIFEAVKIRGGGASYFSEETEDVERAFYAATKRRYPNLDDGLFYLFYARLKTRPEEESSDDGKRSRSNRAEREKRKDRLFECEVSLGALESALVFGGEREREGASKNLISELFSNVTKKREDYEWSLADEGKDVSPNRFVMMCLIFDESCTRVSTEAFSHGLRKMWDDALCDSSGVEGDFDESIPSYDQWNADKREWVFSKVENDSYLASFKKFCDSDEGNFEERKRELSILSSLLSPLPSPFPSPSQVPLPLPLPSISLSRLPVSKSMDDERKKAIFKEVKFRCYFRHEIESGFLNYLKTKMASNVTKLSYLKLNDDQFLFLFKKTRKCIWKSLDHPRKETFCP